MMPFLKRSFLVFCFLVSSSQAAEVIYSCNLKIHCSELHEDQAVSFEYVAGNEKSGAKTVDLGVVRARVYAPHYLSLYLFDMRHPNNIWTKTHSHSFIDDLEVSLIIPEDAEHTMVANLECHKKN